MHRRPTNFKLTDLTVNIPSSNRQALTTSTSTSSKQLAQPRWNTLEFKVYYAVVLLVLPIMIWIPVSLSSKSHSNFPFYRSRLEEGWIPGRLIDNSDAQYRSFRNNVPLLSVAVLAHLATKYIASALSKSPPSSQTRKPSSVPSSLTFNLIFALSAVTILHGLNALKVLLILFLNYSIAKYFKGSKMNVLAVWIFNGAVLLGNEVFEGWKLGQWFEGLAWLDSFAGIYPRWNISFNITMLRLVSFSMDYYWACNRNGKEEGVEAIKEISEKQRQSIAHPDSVYSFANFVAYALYPPLYLAGPIITFNDFMWQHRYPHKQAPTSTPIRTYIVRFVISFLTMECIQHFMWVVAIKDRKAWVGLTPAQISMVGFWNLIIVWLKLLIPWRFFRLWALLDGVDPPENMVRCMANNYSTMGFWRSWHRSYNLWIIRYIYIPLGGAKNVIMNTILVFSFVALWHDLTFRLLAWGWLVSLFIIPELLARWLIPSTKYERTTWYRHVAALGAVGNVLMMMGANLVGFVIGTDGAQFFVGELFGTGQGLRFLMGAVACLFVGVQLMFEYREEEHRQGIQRRC
ncbi:glycerol transporter [Macrolepiota fuliginosa MF-IS2]|uniref:Glycerol transporter n=1 Tax=Macrolepiota fuliginosa MF-IS2 TaxID=1400762 RepID=A0A9P5XFJ8_9AGAR|nr:glycerol transporter [Macrolepiota fuliginosa MF-IS2]